MNIGQQYTMPRYWQTEMHQPSIQPPLPQLDEILSTLNYIATKVRTDGGFSNKMASQLKECGYDVPTAPAKVVMKVFALAVNDAIKEKVDLTDEKGLHQLLTLDTPNPKSTPQPLNYFLNLDLEILEMPTSPLDMAIYLKKDVPQWFVRNIIQHQFDIRWCTPTGKPNDYNFYQFCDMKNTTRLLKYTPRLAHVQATLYKKCRTICGERRISENKEWLCPTVYIKTNGGWKTWRAENEDEFSLVRCIINDLSWIDPRILEFITQNADVQRGDSRESLKNSLKKPTLYWAVLEDKDFVSGEILKLEEIGKTQVYVGKANNGIRGRWTKDKDNHCEMMKKCLDNVFAMTTYDPLRLEGIQLVDARLALAKVRWERTALFVMKTFGDDVEKAKLKLPLSLNKVRKYFVKIPRFSPDIEEINELDSEICEYEQKIFGETAKVFSDNAEISSDEVQAELDTVEKYLNSTEEYFDKVQVSSDGQDMVKKLQQELDEAKDCVEDLQNGSKKDKPLAEELLKEAEKQHRKGKRILNKRLNIIPSGVLRAEGRWEPKNMKYGMNFC